MSHNLWYNYRGQVISLTIQGNVFEADYITIANETYIQVLETDIWQVSDSSDGLDLRETLRFDPDGMENLVLIGEGELDGENVYHLKGLLASDAGGLLNSVPGSLVMVTPMGEVIVGVEFWIGVEDFLVRRTIQDIYMELSSDTGEGGELSLELDMRLSGYGDSVDIQPPNMESTSGPGASESQSVTPIPVIVPPTPEVTATPPLPRPTSEPWAVIDLTERLLWSYETVGDVLPSMVVDGVLYAGSEDSHVYALDASSGELLRSYQVGEGMPAFPTVVGGVIYTGSQDGNVYAIDASNGEPLWSYETDGDAVLFAVMDEVVIAGVKDELFGLDASTGELRWLYEIEGFMFSQSLHSDWVLVEPWDPNIP